MTTPALDEIRLKIATLTEMGKDRDELKNGIRDLQKALLENPSACALLLPEDIGEAVAAIRIYVGKEVLEAAATKAISKKERAKTNLSPQAVDDLLSQEL